MREQTIRSLLIQRPGYEVVYRLLQRDCRRKELADYADTDGGTLERWLKRATNERLVEKKIHIVNESKVVEYSLNCDINRRLRNVIEDRGGRGPRDTCDDFADVGNYHHWSDPHDL